MKKTVVQLLSRVTYLNVILTVNALLLAILVLQNCGFFQARVAVASGVTPVRIESVGNPIPVAIKEPTDSYPPAVRVTPCR
jgi:hypothetical protein